MNLGVNHRRFMSIAKNRLSMAGRRIFLFCALASACLPAFASNPAAPTIQSIQVSGPNVLVTVSVPAGLTKVTLESRTRLGAGAWVPSVVTLTGGVASNVVFTLPRSQNLEVLRVRGDVKDVLPPSFYSGTNQFAGPVSSSDPSTSSSSPTGSLAPGAAGGTTPVATTATTAPVVESDIWEFSGNTLYFFNQRRGLQVIDISQPSAPVLKFTLPLPAVGQQMYLLDTNHVVLLTQDNCGNGNQNDILVVQLTAQGPVVQSKIAVEGSWADSRMVGNILYLAAQSYYTKASSNGVWQWGTVVSSVDLSNPASPKLIDSQQIDGYGNLIYASDDYFFVVTQDYYQYYYYSSVVHPFDITSGSGKMDPMQPIYARGLVENKYNMNYDNGVFSAISTTPVNQNWAVWDTELENFEVGTNNVFSREGSTRLALGWQLQSSRFDGSKAYVVTGDQTSPLWVVDNSDPTNPVVAGKVQISGWSSFIVPLGGQLVTIGAQSNLVSVSLFDVSQPSRPALLSSVTLGDQYSWSFANWDDKSFNVLPNAGLILVPYEGYGTNGYSSQVQLIDLGTNSLILRGVISHPLQPERTAMLDNIILALSESDLLSVDASDRDQPKVVGDAELAWDVSLVIPEGNFIAQLSENDAGAPALRVTSTTDTSTILGELTLTNLPVLGVTTQGQYAYIAQGQGYYFYPIYFNGGWNYPTNGFTLLLSVVDLSQMPNPKISGQTTITNATQGWGYSMKPLWVKTNLLVWSGSPQYFYPLGAGPVVANGAVSTGALAPAGASAIYPWPWWGWGSAGTLTAFDVSNPTAPQFDSEIQVDTNAWAFSQPYNVQNLVYTSYEVSMEITITNSPTVTNAPPTKTGSSNGVDTTQPYWIVQNYLEVIDYTDPLNPTPRTPANLPNQLTGVSGDGAVVYTEGPHLNPQNYYDWSQTYLDASAYDGVSVHLIDSIAFSPNWPQSWLVAGTNVLVARSGYSYTSTNTLPNSLELWTLSSTGKFVMETSLQPAQPIYNLRSLDAGLVLAQGAYSSLFAYDLSNAPAIQQVLQTNLNSCLWFNLSGVTGSRPGGLWVPFGYYGAEQVILPP